MLRRVDKFREQRAGKHGLYKTKLVLFSHFSEVQSRRETLDPRSTPQRGRRQMLAIWLRLQTQPHRLSDQRWRGG
jgi:hypothetical protein